MKKHYFVFFIIVVFFCQVFVCIASNHFPNTVPKTHLLDLGLFKKHYPVVTAPGDCSQSIVLITDFSDNMRLGQAAAWGLLERLRCSGLLGEAEVVVVPGDAANVMGAMLVERLKQYKYDVDFCIVRGNPKGGYVDKVTFHSITSTKEKTLYMRNDQAEKLRGKKVIIFDDVLSTGSTMLGVKKLVEKAGGQVLAFACIATEGADINRFVDKPVIKLAHLPVWKKSCEST